MDLSDSSTEAKGMAPLMPLLKHGYCFSLERVREDAVAHFPSVPLRSKSVFPGTWTVSETRALGI